MFEVIFDRNGAKAYVKNLPVLSKRKICETWFYEIVVDAGKGLEAREFSTFTFSHWANKLRFLKGRHSKLKKEIKNFILSCTAQCQPRGEAKFLPESKIGLNSLAQSGHQQNKSRDDSASSGHSRN
jgi:hypothetical protein